jgi:hypothetical protein
MPQLSAHPLGNHFKKKRNHMRIIFISSLLLVFTSVSMTQDSLQRANKVGLIFAFDGMHFSNFGVKYWITNKLAVQGTFNFQHYRYDNQVNDPTQDETDNTYTPGLGLQYTLLTVDDISLIGSCNGSISFFDSQITYAFASGSPSTILTKNSMTTYNLTFGIGVEFWFSKRWSLAGIQSLTFSQSSSNTSDPRVTGTSTDKQSIQADNAKLILSFYF